MRFSFPKFLIPLWLVCLLFAAIPPAAALAPLFAAEPEAATPAAATQADLLGRETPRSTISGLIRALAEHDYDRAAQYFDLPSNTSRQRAAAAARAREFQALLDSGGSLEPYAALSNDGPGRIGDELPVDRERVGEIRIKGRTIPVLLSRGEEEGLQIWRVSRETATSIAAVTGRQAGQLDSQRPEFTVAGAPLEDWGMLVGLAVLVIGSLWMVATILVVIMRRLVADPAANGVYRFFEAALPPLSLLIAVFVFFEWAERLPVAIVARQTLLRYTGILLVIAFVWFGLRLVDAIAQLAITRMQRRGRRQVVSVIVLLRRTAKVVLLMFFGIGILDTFGIDVTTGIAALGIGGIALALGAQKTVENLVGSVTVIADRPAQVGDFIKVGDVVGTVEDVGIRSTRIRTLGRTLVTIPNGDFSARQIENFAARDRFLFNPVIGVDYRTPAAKIEEAVRIVKGVLLERTDIAEGARANLAAIGERSFHIEVFSYIEAPDWDASVIVREALLMSIIARLEAAGIGLAFPAQTVVFAPEQLDAIQPRAGAQGGTAGT
ncbi:mechanosensitive ion channel family protein [Massilia sp. BSC265]|uniref:mechanosensitive ion channel family protein n=1 Tax=Massilia sp. BSC265 TaxID=1549812 RepID=UPI0004E875AE|nr:mechanosensitive ion channel family protein [Massilia sp. BSC265]KFI06567.1 potassium transporter KefA [Massilia sp. BSC265]